jgi:dihydroorotate dehydrogenase (NAD+) catalytic subunit
LIVADLSTRIGSLTLRNPFIGASGCFGYGVEYAHAVDLSTMGGVAVKGLFLKERQGHPPPRIVETPAGMLNAIGLQGIGVHRFVAEKLPELRGWRDDDRQRLRTTIDEYCEVSRVLSDHEGVAAIELNISCPNIKEGGIQFGCSLHGTHDVVSAVRKVTTLPLIPKLTPNVTDVASFARASEDAGADAVSLVNTFWRWRSIGNADAEVVQRPRRTERPGHPADCRTDGLGVLSGREDSDRRHGRHHDDQRCARIHHRRRAAVQVGTANFVDPFIWTRLIEGLDEYMTRHHIAKVSDLVGSLRVPSHEHA